MRKPKKFDCVKMKHDIQAKLMREDEGLSDEEIDKRRRQKIESNPILGPLYRRMRTANPSH